MQYFKCFCLEKSLNKKVFCFVAFVEKNDIKKQIFHDFRQKHLLMQSPQKCYCSYKILLLRLLSKGICGMIFMCYTQALIKKYRHYLASTWYNVRTTLFQSQSNKSTNEPTVTPFGLYANLDCCPALRSTLSAPSSE